MVKEFSPVCVWPNDALKGMIDTLRPCWAAFHVVVEIPTSRPHVRTAKETNMRVCDKEMALVEPAKILGIQRSQGPNEKDPDWWATSGDG